MTASGVFTSCATPAASKPSDVSFSVCDICSSIRSRCVTSSNSSNRPIRSPDLLTSGVIDTFIVSALP